MILESRVAPGRFLAFPCALFLLLLAGCVSGPVQQVATFTAADAANAATVAGSDVADPQATTRKSCYVAWANLAGGIAALPANSGGIFTAVEAGIELQATLQLPSCQAIAGQVLLWALRKAPGGNLLP